MPNTTGQSHSAQSMLAFKELIDKNQVPGPRHSRLGGCCKTARLRPTN
jgi:hypothetical protein